jgi:hypothetical protein
MATVLVIGSTFVWPIGRLVAPAITMSDGVILTAVRRGSEGTTVHLSAHEGMALPPLGRQSDAHP